MKNTKVKNNKDDFFISEYNKIGNFSNAKVVGLYAPQEKIQYANCQNLFKRKDFKFFNRLDGFLDRIKTLKTKDNEILFFAKDSININNISKTLKNECLKRNDFEKNILKLENKYIVQNKKLYQFELIQ